MSEDHIIATVNIGGDADDQFYRYTRPKCIVEYLPDCHKTRIVNIEEIALALRRPVRYIRTFLRINLNVKGSEKSKVINGNWNVKCIESHLEHFIAKFVLCQACSSPEASIEVLDKRIVELNCVVCGHHCELSDDIHPLVAYIRENPPTHREKLEFGQTGVVDEEGDRIFKEAQLLHISSLDDETDEDTSEDEEDYDAIDIARLSDIIHEQGVDVDSKFKAMAPVLLGRDFPSRMRLIASACLTKFTTKRFKFTMGVLAKLCSSTKMQKDLSLVIAEIISENDQLIKRTKDIFFTLYDSEVLSERVILDWDQKKYSDERVHVAAEPFITWLLREDEESSDEDE